MLVFSESTDGQQTLKRYSISLSAITIRGRDLVRTIALSDGNSSQVTESKNIIHVSGIRAYVEQLTVPGANAFLPMLLILWVAIAAIIVEILPFKLMVETWALCGHFQSL